jgi:hypothetical protein
VFLGFAGISGLIALVSPRVFHKLAAGGSRWIDTSRFVAKLDRPIDLDRLVLPYSRVLGAAVLVAVVVLGLVVQRF